MIPLHIKLEKLPSCKHCGSDRTISKGRNIKCKDCRRLSPKISRHIKIPIGDRPLCPECGTSNPYSAGSREGMRFWSCRVCGREYSAQSERDKVELLNMEVQTE